MSRRSSVSRRNFLKTAIAAATPLVLTTEILGREGYVPPSEKIVMGHIGYGNRGHDNVGSFISHNEVRYVAVSDCWQSHLDRGRSRINGHYRNNDCKGYAKYEELLADEKIDAISIATPDHWHTKIAVEACKAGKDVFSEKPLTLTPLESRQIVAAARKYNRVCSSGSQRVMEDYGYMAPIVASGALGEIKEAFYEVGPAPWDPYYPAEPIPEGLDWDRWLGPAPYVPFHGERCSGSYGGGWRRYWDYGNGFLADWGAHKLGGLLYVLGMDLLEPLEILPPNCKENPENRLTFIYPNGIKIHHVRGGHDITIVGSERTFRHRGDSGKIKPIAATDVRRYNGGVGDITSDVLYCFRHRLRPFQDFAYGAATALSCQLANITYHVNRPLKWNAETTSFTNDEQANRLVNRPKRSPYIIGEI
jgi:predicted dehydrogenase